VSLWFAIVLGVAQGLTEFLPISSTAHLRILPALLGQHDPGAAYTAVLQLGTLAAVIIYFARDLFIDMPRAFFTDRKSPGALLPLYLVVATLPIAIAGIALEDFIVGDARSLWVVSGALIVVGLLMAFIDARARNLRGVHEMHLVDALLIGGAQALALIPGVSRSGATICCALVLGLRRTEAARFSFLMSIPAVAGAGIFKMDDAIAELGGDAVASLVVGTVVSGLVGYASIAWLMKFLGSRRLVGFAAYRVALGVALVALLAAGALSPFAGV
jgi:undecaprenyl-diphosphatase